MDFLPFSQGIPFLHFLCPVVKAKVISGFTLDGAGLGSASAAAELVLQSEEKPLVIRAATCFLLPCGPRGHPLCCGKFAKHSSVEAEK